MKFLYLKAANSINDLPSVLISMGHEVDMAEQFPFHLDDSNPKSVAAMRDFLDHKTYDFAISYQFINEASDVCQEYHLKYISWVFDSPSMPLFTDAVYNPVNYIFIFDRKEAERLQKLPIPHIRHLPMGTNTSRTGILDISSVDMERFSCDISFVGNLYENNIYNKAIHLMPEECAVPVKHELMRQLCNWHEPKEWIAAPDYIVDFFHNTLNLYPDPQNMDINLFMGYHLYCRKLAEMDRLTVLNTLAEHYPVHLYTNSTSSFLSNIHVHPRVDYYIDMTKVFHLSKINLNITLPSIESGLPARVLDIMGCGGFVLTNYQPEVEELFEIGQDIEVFHDLEELLQKTNYYLTHEKERIRIAVNGYRKVLESHTYEQRINTMIACASGE